MKRNKALIRVGAGMKRTKYPETTGLFYLPLPARCKLFEEEGSIIFWTRVQWNMWTRSLWSLYFEQRVAKVPDFGVNPKSI